MTNSIYTRKYLKEWIQTHLINENGKLNPNSSRDRWWEPHKEILDAIKQEIFFIKFKKISGYIHLILQDIYEIPKCHKEDCNNKVTFQRKSFKKYCSPSCSASQTGKKNYRPLNIEEILYTTSRKPIVLDFNIKPQDVKQWLTENVVDKNGKINNWRVQEPWWKKRAKILNVIIEQTEFLTDEPCVFERIYCILNDIKKIKICKCGAKIEFRRGIYGKNCSTKCINEKQFIIDRNKEWYESHKDKTLIEIGQIINLHPTCVQRDLNRFDIQRPKIGNFSTGEKEVLQFIQSSYKGQIRFNTKQVIRPLELDIYLPELKLAFEYNGIYWHSELHGIDKQYHLNKTNLCEKKGIRLVHIFETDWLHKAEIVKSRIKSILHNNETIYARKCEIKTVDYKESKKFLINNHIQGSCPSSINLGLYFQDELVALMTFGKSRFNKKVEWELLRFCNTLNTSVIGGASKLYKYFKVKYEPKSIISYSDKRWNTGGLYETLGMVKQKSSPPNYWYFKGQEIFSRVRFQKHKLKQLLDNFNPLQTEWQNMVNNGWNRIWDCGNDVYTS